MKLIRQLRRYGKLLATVVRHKGGFDCVSAPRFEQSLAREVPFVRLSMLEEGDDVLFIGIREQEVFRLLTGILVCGALVNLKMAARKVDELRRTGYSVIFFNNWKLRVTSWEECELYFQTKFKNRYTRRLYKSTKTTIGMFQPGVTIDLGKTVFTRPCAPAPSFPVDVVYTWVDHQDEGWQRQYRQYTAQQSVTGETVDAMCLCRFYNRNELYYSVFSLKRFAPWIRRVYIVTNCRPHDWMLADPMITIVSHDQILEPRYLPTFSSHAIESALHKIPDLSNCFLYFNDDIFLTAPVYPEDFFTLDRKSKINFEPYGMVYGETSAQDPDYLNAARNGRKLIEDHFGFSPTRLHQHCPFALRVNLLQRLEQIFGDELAVTRGNRFRATNDVSVTSFFYHYFALAQGEAVESYFPSLLIQSGKNFESLFYRVMNGQAQVKSVCINDGMASHENREWTHQVDEFLAWIAR